MKKTRFIALVLAVSLMIMGSGYAYWSETIFIKNVVNTGNLDVAFQSATAKTAKHMDATAVVNADDNILNVTINRMRPDGWAEVEFVVVNKGTVPVKYLDAVPVRPTDGSNAALFDALEKSVSVVKGSWWPFDSADAESSEASFGFDKKDTVIQPNGTQKFVLDVKMDWDEEKFESTSVNFDVKVNFEQARYY